MIKTQVQIPNDLFLSAKKTAAFKEWSFAEITRRGLEYMVETHSHHPQKKWKLPSPLHLGSRSVTPEELKRIAQED